MPHQNNQGCYECAENPAERSLGFGAIILQQVGELQAERRPEGSYPPSQKTPSVPARAGSGHALVENVVRA